MPDNDDLTSVQTYRNLVLQYEAMHAGINALFQTHPGGTETMTERELTMTIGASKARLVYQYFHPEE